jgi:hypothetical protein
MQEVENDFDYRDAALITRQTGLHDPDEILISKFGKPFAEYRQKWKEADQLRYLPENFVSI